MNRSKRSKFVSLFLIAIFFGIILVQAAGASSEKAASGNGDDGPKFKDDCSAAEWMEKHTVEVKATAVYEYTEEGVLVITETYSGDDLLKKFNENQLTKTRKLSVPQEKEITINVEGESFTIQRGDAKTLVSLKSVVIVSAKNPFPWWKYYDYPQWTWSQLSSRYYEREDPVNLAWEGAGISTVKAVILGKGWYDWVSEYTYYVYDPYLKKWVPGDGVADDPFRVLGGYHARLWQVGDAVVSGAHHDDSVFIVAGHQADEFETAEGKVAGFFGGWAVYPDSVYLNNLLGSPGSEPFNDGYATLIVR